MPLQVTTVASSALILPMESSELRPLSAVVEAAFVSSLVLALFSLAGAGVTRYQCDRHGGIIAVAAAATNWLTRANVKAAQSSRNVTENYSLYVTYDKLFDCIWFSQIFVVIAAIALYGNGYRSFALVLGIYRALFQQLHWFRFWTVERKMSVWFAAGGNVLALLGLLASGLLACYGIGSKVLLLSIVSLSHVWSSIEGVIYLWPWEKTWPEGKMWCWEQTWSPRRTTREEAVFVQGILMCSLLSQSCWAALHERDNDSFVAVSLNWYSYRFMLMTQIVYFTCVPEELLWSGHMLLKCWGRWRRCSGSHFDAEDDLSGLDSF
ncbi:hypothetical protein VTK56DRAFT_4233 [Thermocarpiscus australiensis]